MNSGEFTRPRPDEEEVARLQSLGFERLASSGYLVGGDLLVEERGGMQRLYAPFDRVDPERVEAIRLSGMFMGRPTPGNSTQVVQQNTPERVARRGNEREFLELRASGSGGPLKKDRDADAIAELSALRQVGIGQQLEDAGFVGEVETETTRVLRFIARQEELVAVVSQDQLKGLFIPLDQTERPDHLVNSPALKIVGITEFRRDFEDSSCTAVRASNGWAEFTIDPRYTHWPVHARLLREPSPDELGVLAIPEKAEPGGFVQGGINITSDIRRLTSLNEIPVSRLESAMRPGSLSGAGFLGDREGLTDILIRDNIIVRSHGLTHQDLAMPLRYIEQLYRLGIFEQTDLDMPSTPGLNELTIGGHSYKIGVTTWRGYQESPFGDNTRTDHDFTILNLETGHALSISGLVPEMIARYGFYEGTGTPYRAAPEDILRLFSHLHETEQAANLASDPVVELTSGHAQSVTLTTPDQVTRFRRLYEAGIPRAMEAQVTIRFPSATELFTFLNARANASLTSYLDASSLTQLEAAPLVLERYGAIQRFAEVLARLDEAVQHQVIALVANVAAASGEGQHERRLSLLQDLLKESVAERDGVLQKKPIAGLVAKLDYRPAEFLHAFYRAAGGRYSESISHRIGEARATTRHSRVELDEARARALTTLFGDQIMPFVEAFSEALGIGADQPREEQVVAFLRKYHLIEKTQGIAGHYLVRQNRPDLDLPDWVRISEVVDRLRHDMQPDDVDGADREFLSSRNLSLQDLLDARRLYPVGDVETVVLQLYNGALRRQRG